MLPTVHSLLSSHAQAEDILKRLQSIGIPDDHIAYVRYGLAEPTAEEGPAKEAETNTDSPGDTDSPGGTGAPG